MTQVLDLKRRKTKRISCKDVQQESKGKLRQMFLHKGKQGCKGRARGKWAETWEEMRIVTIGESKDKGNSLKEKLSPEEKRGSSSPPSLALEEGRWRKGGKGRENSTWRTWELSFFLHSSTQNAVSQKGSLGFQTGKVWVRRSLGRPAPKHPVMRPCSLSFFPFTPQHCLPLRLFLFGSQPKLFCVRWVCSVQTGRMATPPQTNLPLSQLSSCCRVQMLAALSSTPIGPLWIPAPCFEPEMQYHDWPGPSQTLFTCPGICVWPSPVKPLLIEVPQNKETCH